MEELYGATNAAAWVDFNFLGLKKFGIIAMDKFSAPVVLGTLYLNTT
jgi:hypothetical protein